MTNNNLNETAMEAVETNKMKGLGKVALGVVAGLAATVGGIIIYRKKKASTTEQVEEVEEEKTVVEEKKTAKTK